jgi:hypothetical protein
VSCDRIRPLLSAYLDGELDLAQRTTVTVHLATCQECAHVLDDFRALGQEIRALPNAPLPVGMEAEFRTRLHKQSTHLVSRLHLLARGLPTVVLVAALVALAIGMPIVMQRVRPLRQERAKVITIYPPDRAIGVPLDANLMLTFSWPMERTSVEAAIHITPEMPLIFSWQGETLTMAPFTDWRPATMYTLTVASTTHDVSGVSLGEPFVLCFETATDGKSPEGLFEPTGRFAQIWRAELGGSDGSLGYATTAEQEPWCVVQRFQHGLMIWVDQLYRDHIYVLGYGADQNSGAWQRHLDSWHGKNFGSCGVMPPQGFVEPRRNLGWIWQEKLGGSDAQIGWALEPEQPYVGSIQSFEHGLMSWSPLDGVIYVLWNDFTWAMYPPASK